VDRWQHQQNIGLRNSESRSCWLAIAGNVIGFLSGVATVAAGSSAAMGLVGQIASKFVTFGPGVVFVVTVTNGLRNKIRKLLTRRKFIRRLIDIYNCEKHQSEKEKSHQKFWGIVKDFVTVDVLRRKCRIPGIPNDHFFQEEFKIFKGKKKYEFTLLNLQTANRSVQDDAQISFDMNRNRCIPFDNMLGLSCNGMQSEEQHSEMAAELTGNRNSIYMSECGDGAVINFNDGADVIMVQ
jgi:fructose-1,6-bisphosphatase